MFRFSDYYYVFNNVHKKAALKDGVTKSGNIASQAEMDSLPTGSVLSYQSFAARGRARPPLRQMTLFYKNGPSHRLAITAN